MDRTPLISVIIPNYNHADFLRQRIETVLKQSYSHIEIIVLDDASTDGSVSIIKEYEKHPLVKKVILNHKNSGSPFLQWQKGVSFAAGDWVWIAESDDYASENFLQSLINALSGHSGAGLAYCDSIPVLRDGTFDRPFKERKNNQLATHRWSSDYSNNGRNEIADYLLRYGTINNTSAVLMNRQILMEADPFDLPLRYIGDKYTFIKMLSLSDIVYVQESLNYFRDPFSNKHIELHLSYFYEQFLIFDWVYRHLEIPKSDFYAAFYDNTTHSVFRDWSAFKIQLYSKLFARNPGLMLKCVINNATRPFIKRHLETTS